MDKGAWQATVHEVAKSWMQLSNWGILLYLIYHLQYPYESPFITGFFFFFFAEDEMELKIK